jgi:hypothetical protein
MITKIIQQKNWFNFIVYNGKDINNSVITHAVIYSLN